MTDFAEFPKWVDVDGPGNPDSPGRVLVNNEDEERQAKASGKGPAGSNPPPNPGQKSLDEMDRNELKEILMREGIPDDMSDDDIRSAIKHGREQRAKFAEEDAERARKDREAREAGGDHGDGTQTGKAQSGDADAGTDAAGDTIPFDPTDTRASNPDAPAAKAQPATDARPKEMQEKQADDKSAGNVTEQAATPAGNKRGSSAKPGKE